LCRAGMMTHDAQANMQHDWCARVRRIKTTRNIRSVCPKISVIETSRITACPRPTPDLEFVKIQKEVSIAFIKLGHEFLTVQGRLQAGHTTAGAERCYSASFSNAGDGHMACWSSLNRRVTTVPPPPPPPFLSASAPFAP
jgi:hypothetical protein